MKKTMIGKTKYNIGVNKDILTNRIILNAMLPVMKVLLEDDPKIKKTFEGVQATIQFKAKNNTEDLGAYLVFNNGDFKVNQGISDSPDISFSFKTIGKMNGFFAGKMVFPKIDGWLKILLLVKFFSLLLGMMILKPEVRPQDPKKKRLKVKMSFYMITTALSQYNKGGDPEMVKWTKKQPNRIYQISVDPEIAAYLRVKAGKTKAGRGFYTKKRPFVHLKFNGVDGAFPIVMNDLDMVSAIKKGYLVIEGSPEYGGNLGDFMVRIQNLLV